MTKLPLQQIIHFQAGGHKVSFLACPLLFGDAFSEKPFRSAIFCLQSFGEVHVLRTPVGLKNIKST